MTDKKTKKSRGAAFVEFDNLSGMSVIQSQTPSNPPLFNFQAAIKLHRTMIGNREINVEPTAGGGGKGENRKKKIDKKNAKLQNKRQKVFLFLFS
jgi:nucleolar protein 6